MKLKELSKALYLEHGWRLPRGLTDFRAREAKNFTLQDWQQAKRLGRDPNLMKTLVRECWASSDTKDAFVQALDRRGLALARGDRRDHVVVAYDGTIRAIPRLIGKKIADVKARLGESHELSTVAEARQGLAARIAPRLKSLVHDADRARSIALAPLYDRRDAMKAQHVAERQTLDGRHQARAVLEAKERSSRLRGGVMGIWDRLTGRHGRTVKQNEVEALFSRRRDGRERDALVADQLIARRGLQRDILAARHRHVATVLELHRDLARQPQERPSQRKGVRGGFADAARGRSLSVSQEASSSGSRNRVSEREGATGPRGLGIGR